MKLLALIGFLSCLLFISFQKPQVEYHKDFYLNVLSETGAYDVLDSKSHLEFYYLPSTKVLIKPISFVEVQTIESKHNEFRLYKFSPLSRGPPVLV